MYFFIYILMIDIYDNTANKNIYRTIKRQYILH